MDRLTLLVDLADAELAGALDCVVGYLRRAGVHVARGAGPGTGPLLAVSDRALTEEAEEALLAGVRAGRPTLLLGPTLAAWRERGRLLEAAGLTPGRAAPVHEVRVRPGRDAGDLTARWDGDLLVTDTWPVQDKVLDDVEVLLTANLHLVDHPVCTLRRGDAVVGALTLGSRPQTLRDPAFQRVVHRWLRAALGETDGGPVRVGLLGYGAIGHEHNEAIAATAGLELAAVCDTNPARVEAARALAPELTAYADGAQLLAADDVDLVIVSTPPNTHAAWALRALEAGKSAVVEKPFCLTVAEADRMIEAAAAHRLALAVYQNRRWDADFLALKRLVRSGALGEVFHYESFIGSFGHPCNYWHSDEEVSGGAIYDWGSHYLDWALDLLPQQVDHVTAATHKRMWHDVTNADHSRVTIRFTDGVEAEFIHSDLAAAMKPKWYVLGTGGAVTGEWRAEKVVARNAVGALLEDPLAASESPADLWLHAPDGSRTAVAVPPPPRQPFHRELADQLLSGAPMSLTPEGSRRNIAVMEAATISARAGGRPVALPTA